MPDPGRHHPAPRRRRRGRHRRPDRGPRACSTRCRRPSVTVLEAATGWAASCAASRSPGTSSTSAPSRCSPCARRPIDLVAPGRAADDLVTPGDHLGVGVVARRPAAAAARHADGRADRPGLGPRHPHRRRGRAAARRAALAAAAHVDRRRLGRRLRRRPARRPPSSTGWSSRCSAGSTPATPAGCRCGRRCRCSGRARPAARAWSTPAPAPHRHPARGAPEAPGRRSPGCVGGVGRLPELVADDAGAAGRDAAHRCHRPRAASAPADRLAAGLGSAADPEVVEADAVLVCVPPPRPRGCSRRTPRPPRRWPASRPRRAPW